MTLGGVGNEIHVCNSQGLLKVFFGKHLNIISYRILKKNFNAIYVTIAKCSSQYNKHITIIKSQFSL